jgi:hypothetical protein
MSSEKEYLGFLSTNHLFNEAHNLPFNTFSDELENNQTFSAELEKGLRLGNRVERYVVHQLISNDYKILVNNLQVISEGRTLGELDCIISKNDIITHLEIVCKFYLFDDSTGKDELDHWIGPNRKDSLVEKLNKLKSKQLPLLNNPITKNVLLNSGIERIHNQKVFFVAQLFTPYYAEPISFNVINSQCHAGSYLSIDNINLLKDSYFYIPPKNEWLQTPTNDVHWMNFGNALDNLSELICNKKSPLCWIKNKNNEIEKVFITWW